jgi:hypothetical protein
MATTATTVTARKAFRCHGMHCNHVIQPGEEYARHVAFPGDEVNDGPRPRVMRLCRQCQTAYERPMPPRRRKASA